MSIYIFAGPTLSAAEGRNLLDATFLPPAAQGDVYRVARLRPRAIGIIDGYFEHVPSIAHKEILWAMREGVQVFGSASMGALRAAELAAFGMEGVGAIFAAYMSGELEDDDEVAVAHATAEHGFRPLSTALVNIRATLAAAQEMSIIRAEIAADLLAIARSLFYPERTYGRIMDAAVATGCNQAELNALRAWLPTGEVDQKRADAIAMLGLIRERMAAGEQPKRADYQFEHTLFWDNLVNGAGELSRAGATGAGTLPLEGLLEEARLDPTAYKSARLAALNTALAAALADRQGQGVTPAQVEQAIGQFRRARGLLDAASTEAWLRANDLDARRLIELMEREVLTQAVGRWAAPTLTAAVIDQLRLQGSYPQLLERAARKQRALEAIGLAEPTLESAGVSREELLHWHFGNRPIPVSLRLHALEAGFRDEQAFIRALLREYCYARLL